MPRQNKNLQTVQLRGYCSRAGYQCLHQVLDMSRILYNAALQERRDAYRHSKKQVSYTDQQNQLTLIKQDLPEYREIDNRVWRATIWKLDKSFNAFFRRIKRGERPGYPRFKPSSRYNTIEMVAAHPGMLKTSPDGRKDWLQVKGLPTIETRPSRTLPDSSLMKTFRITMRPTGVTVDLVYARPAAENPPAVGPAIGIDLGVNQRLTLSDGTIVQPRQVDRTNEENLHRKVSTARKGSNRRRKRVKAL